MSRIWLGIDLGGTKTAAMLESDDRQVLARSKMRTEGHEGADSTLERMVAMLGEMCAEAGVDRNELAGVGIGCPGPLDLVGGLVLDSPNLGWGDFPLRERLAEALHCPVLLVNDVDAGVYGEYARGAAKGARCVLGAFPGTGVGGGCVYEGRLLRGRRASALELGHIQVVPNGPLCGCGRRGCLEAVAGRLAIAAQLATAAYRGDAPTIRELAGTDIGMIRSSVIRRAIEAGDTIVEEIVRIAAHNLGRGLASVINILNPDTVVLGGGLVEALPQLYLDEVQAGVAEQAMQAMLEELHICASQLGDDAAMIGVIELVRRDTAAGK